MRRPSVPFLPDRPAAGHGRSFLRLRSGYGGRCPAPEPRSSPSRRRVSAHGLRRPRWFCRVDVPGTHQHQPGDRCRAQIVGWCAVRPGWRRQDPGPARCQELCGRARSACGAPATRRAGKSAAAARTVTPTATSPALHDDGHRRTEGAAVPDERPRRRPRPAAYVLPDPEDPCVGNRAHDRPGRWRRLETPPVRPARVHSFLILNRAHHPRTE